MQLQPKKHLRLLSQLRSNQEDDVEYEDCDYYDTEHDLHRSYAKPRIIHEDDNDEELSDYVKFRLYIARQKALEAYARAKKTA